jgi:hypothetical protein
VEGEDEDAGEVVEVEVDAGPGEVEGEDEDVGEVVEVEVDAGPLLTAADVDVTSTATKSSAGPNCKRLFASPQQPKTV